MNIAFILILGLIINTNTTSAITTIITSATSAITTSAITLNAIICVELYKLTNNCLKM